MVTRYNDHFCSFMKMDKALDLNVPDGKEADLDFFCRIRVFSPEGETTWD